ncbi:MAG: 2-dehydropantoate 2-reductase [Bacillaceae bacterium]
MKIGIIGAGAIGLLCGAAFSKVGYDVTMVTRSQRQAAEINDSGIDLTYHAGKERIAVSAIPFEESDFLFDLIVVAVKEYQLEPIINKLMNETNKTVLFIQNGMGHLHVKDRLNHHRIYFGIVEHGVKKESSTAVNWNGIGRIVVGADEKDAIFSHIHERCANFFSIHLIGDIMSMMKKKLLANVCINPLTAMLNVKNGELIKNEHFQQMMKMIYNETISVLQIEDKEKNWQYVYDVCVRTGENTSSMRGDILSGNKTEIDAIVGYVLTQCKDAQKEIPLLYFVYQGIKGLE